MRKRLLIALLLPAALLLAIQWFGMSATDSELQPLFSLPSVVYWPIVGIGMLCSLVAPITATTALVLVARGDSSGALRACLIVCCLVLTLTSWAGFLWTFSGHPTWLQGYALRDVH